MVTGPVGVGKSTIATAAGRQLSAASVPHAVVDLAWIGECWPMPADDPWHERLIHRNLACLWANFSAAGADRLVLARVLEHRSVLRPLLDAVPGAKVTVVRLQAPLPLLHARIRAREVSDPAWYLNAASHTQSVLDLARVEDHLVENADRAADDVAEEVLRLVGWLPPNAGT
jgi:hypothetical protein